MKLRISGWKSEGLRCPDIPVKLVYDKGRPNAGTVHLIQMPNGTGKTTTLELLRACLTGSAAQWTDAQTLAYRPTESDARGQGYFEVDLEYDGKPVTIRLTLDFDGPSATYGTTSPTVGGFVPDWRPPTLLRRFLNPEFMKLLIFDGEFAADLLTPGKTNADQALNAMCQLHLIDDVFTFAIDERDARVRAAGRGRLAMKGKSLERNEGELQIVKKLIAQLEGKRVKLRAEQTDLSRKISEHDSDITALFDKGETDDPVSRAKQQLDEAEQAQDTSLENFWRALRNPYTVSPVLTESVVEFRRQLDKVKLPDATSRQFFVELASETQCVCGRPIGGPERELILSQSAKFLGDQEAGVLNALKLDVDQATPELIGAFDRYCHALAGNLTTDLVAVDTAQAELDIAKQTSAGTDRAKYERLKLELEELRRREQDVGSALQELERTAKRSEPPDSFCIDYQKRRLRELEKEVETLTGTVDIGERTRILEEILVRAKAATREAVRAHLIEEGNTLLRQILRNSPIQIADVVPHIKLRSQAGASVGQKLAVGYVFLGELLDRKAHSLPLVVDSPANSIDLTVGREIGRMIPRLCDQFITFVISRERPGFVDELERSASFVQHMTIFRKLPGTKKFLEKAPQHGRTESDRAVLVEDRKFFHSFDTEASREK